MLTRAALEELRKGATRRQAEAAKRVTRNTSHGHADTSRTRGPKLEPHQVILRPLVTEKGTHQFTHHNAYPFEVNLWATKDADQGGRARSCSTCASRRCGRRTGWARQRRYRFQMGKLPNWKKAIVTLHAEDRIEFF